MIRKFIFWCHLIVAVITGFLIFVMAVTGAMLAFEPQIVEFAERGVRRVTPPQGTVRLNVGDIVSRVSAVRSGAVPAAVTLKSDARASVVVSFGRKDAVFVDPYTGAVLGKGSKFHDAMHFIESVHRRLATREKGRVTTGACNAAFLFLLVSGFYLWWPKNWSRSKLKSITVFSPGLSGKARDWNWHNVIGFWCAPFFLATTVTGLVMSYAWANNLLFRLTGNEPPVQQQKRGPEGRGSEGSALILPPIGLDALFEHAGRQSPGWVSMNLRLSQGADAPVTVMIEEPAPFGSANPKSQLTLNAKTADIIRWEPFTEQNLGRKLRFWAKWLHTGQLWGIAGQLLAGVAAIGAAMMVYTGFAMAWRRFFLKGR